MNRIVYGNEIFVNYEYTKEDEFGGIGDRRIFLHQLFNCYRKNED